MCIKGEWVGEIQMFLPVAGYTSNNILLTSSTTNKRSPDWRCSSIWKTESQGRREAKGDAGSCDHPETNLAPSQSIDCSRTSCSQELDDGSERTKLYSEDLSRSGAEQWATGGNEMKQNPSLRSMPVK